MLIRKGGILNAPRFIFSQNGRGRLICLKMKEIRVYRTDINFGAVASGYRAVP